MKFKLKADFRPSGDQPQAIEKLTQGIKAGVAHQVLLGVTGSGKTFSVAKVIQNVQKPTLVISHNKTLAAQLYQEFRDFFPQNAVSYFVSYYDYYQPEAYLPSTDTYIEKETDINQEIDKLRLATTTNLLTRKDTIVVASVSCIYNIGSPKEYGHFVLEIGEGMKVSREQILTRLTQLQYDRGDFGFQRGTFRARGDTIDLFPAYRDEALRIELAGEEIKKLSWIDPLSGKKLEGSDGFSRSTVIYPAKHYMTDPKKQRPALTQIRQDLEERVKWFLGQDKELEANRLRQRVNYDLEMIEEVGYVNGIENYSRYFDGRKPGEPPYTLLDYFPQDYLLVIDESHITIPQIQGMYRGDKSRKETLVEFGFRLPAAFDNRPLRFDEFSRRVNQVIYTSATPDQWEITMACESAMKLKNLKTKELKNNGVVEQLVRPTGLVDPQIDIRPSAGQIDDLMAEIEKRVANKERVLVTTLTKRMAEDLADFLKEKGVRVHYLHSDIKTLDRTDILDDLRLGKYDVVVGINLLREGLDLPEVSLVAILDADKEGFLRSETSLIQVMGRAARHEHGRVIMYADEVTGSMQRAIDEVGRRRQVQVEYNQKYKITPKTIQKPIREKLVERERKEERDILHKRKLMTELDKIKVEDLVPSDRTKLIRELTREMRLASQDLNFELAAVLRDKIREIEAEVGP